jgi:hypothetical protein
MVKNIREQRDYSCLACQKLIITFVTLSFCSGEDEE